MRLADFTRESCSALEKLYPSPEARGLVLLLCRERLGVESYTYVIEPGYEIPDEKLARLKVDMSRLCTGEPLQYVLGYAYFFGRRFNVDRSVLIPRPETEQMVETAIRLLRKSDHRPRVLDLCTGSGCIAWTMALELPGTEVVAVDISEPALSVARSQFRGVPDGVSVPEFICSDVLSGCQGVEGRFDLIVSNPPYIMNEEKAEMRPNVLDHEPGLALFVPDEDPLLFYRAIASVSGRLLDPSGIGLVEINERFGPQTADLFRRAGYKKTEILCDLYGKNRFVEFCLSL